MIKKSFLERAQLRPQIRILGLHRIELVHQRDPLRLSRRAHRIDLFPSFAQRLLAFVQLTLELLPDHLGRGRHLLREGERLGTQRVVGLGELSTGFGLVGGVHFYISLFCHGAIYSGLQVVYLVHPVSHLMSNTITVKSGIK